MTIPSDTTVFTVARRAEVRRLVSSLSFIARGTATMGVSDLQRIMMIRIGLAALGRIRDAFVIKARGGVDETGLRWKPLKPKTIAYSRRHPVLDRQGQPTGRRIPSPGKRAQFRPSWMLTKRQRERWWQLYRKYLAIYGRKDRAAKIAWVILKSEGARTLLATYGGTKVEILRDTGLLLTSLSPALLPANRPTSAPRVANQIFRLDRGEVIVGTNRKGAIFHHRGIPNKLPQRRLWPEPSRWPKTWWNDILAVAREGLIDIVLGLLQRR